MLELTGTPISGCGIASETIALQKPFLMRWFPEIEHCHIGTINLRLNAGLVIANPDIRTDAFQWSASWTEYIPPESFCLTQFEFDVSGGASGVTGWVYEASWSVHRSDVTMIEFLAPFTPYQQTDVFSLRFREPNKCQDLYYL
ncbi:MAG: hypothetical protein AAGF35_15170 [Pseudomonadota bacterium]